MYDSTSKAKYSEVGFPTRAIDSNEYGTSSASTSLGAALHFEPFFVPRDAVLHEPAHRDELQKLGVEIFNRSPGHGLAFLIAAGGVRDYPVEINSFLVRIGADPEGLGNFLGEDFPIAQTLRLEFLNSLPLLGTGVVAALETSFHEMAVPSGWVKADRLTRGIAHFWWRQHEEECHENLQGGLDVSRTVHGVGSRGELAGLELQRLLLGSECLHRLMFSALLLHQWLRQGQFMTLSEWVQLNTGIEVNGNDVPMHVQTGIYKCIVEGNVSLSGRPVPSTLPLAPIMEGWSYVHYSGRAQITTGTDAAAWPDASPRVLAQQGGAASVGRAGDVLLANPGDVPDEKVGMPFDTGNSSPVGEATWLSLHASLLLLSTGTLDAPPYGFVSLRHAVLKEVDSASRRIVITSRTDVGMWLGGGPALAAGEEEWLELCLLLGDGRFQPLEAPHLELRIATEHDFQVWTKTFRELCYDDPMLRPGKGGGFQAEHETHLNQVVDKLLEARLAPFGAGFTDNNAEPQKPPPLPREEVFC